MNNLIETALIISGVFIVCYPIVMYLLNRIMNKIENEATQTKSPV